MSNVQYKGIAGCVRRELNNGTLTGEITFDKVRALLRNNFPDAIVKHTTPNNVIRNSLLNMAKSGEISTEFGKFFAKKEAAMPTSPVPGAVLMSILGYVNHGMVLADGRCAAMVEIVKMAPYIKK